MILLQAVVPISVVTPMCYRRPMVPVIPPTLSHYRGNTVVTADRVPIVPITVQL